MFEVVIMSRDYSKTENLNKHHETIEKIKARMKLKSTMLIF